MQWMSKTQKYSTQHTSVETNFVQYENGEISTKVQLVPSTGVHYMFYKGLWIKVERTREKNVVDFTSGSLWETITLTTIGRNRKIFEDILAEAREMALKNEEGNFCDTRSDC